MKVLLVEDNELNRDMLARRLIRKGFEVVIAVDGREGVEMAASEAPDLVLMDMQMPVMDGYEATRCLRAQGYDAPIIAFTTLMARAEASSQLDLYSLVRIGTLSVCPSIWNFRP